MKKGQYKIDIELIKEKVREIIDSDLSVRKYIGSQSNFPWTHNAFIKQIKKLEIESPELYKEYKTYISKFGGGTNQHTPYDKNDPSTFSHKKYAQYIADLQNQLKNKK